MIARHGPPRWNRSAEVVRRARRGLGRLARIMARPRSPCLAGRTGGGVFAAPRGRELAAIIAPAPRLSWGGRARAVCVVAAVVPVAAFRFLVPVSRSVP